MILPAPMSIAPSAPPRLVRVAVAVPLADAFDYLWSAPGDVPPAGSRVRVPFGRRERIGVVLDHPSTTALRRAEVEVDPRSARQRTADRRRAHADAALGGRLLPLPDRRGPESCVAERTARGPCARRAAGARVAAHRARPAAISRTRRAQRDSNRRALLAVLADRSLTEADLKLAAVGAATLARLAAKRWIEAGTGARSAMHRRRRSCARVAARAHERSTRRRRRDRAGRGRGLQSVSRCTA